ncbi:MAG TPA: hypothetical protein VGK62_03570 [Gaiellaceae bacterium]
MPDDDSRRAGEHLHAEGLSVPTAKVLPAMTQTKFTIAALVVGFTIAALIVLSAITMGAVAGT